MSDPGPILGFLQPLLCQIDRRATHGTWKEISTSPPPVCEIRGKRSTHVLQKTLCYKGVGGLRSSPAEVKAGPLGWGVGAPGVSSITAWQCCHLSLCPFQSLGNPSSLWTPLPA